MMKVVVGILICVFILVILYFVGPKAKKPSFDVNTDDYHELPKTYLDQTVNLQKLEKQINEREASVPNVKPDNEARIIWAEAYEYQKSPYSLVYLHGFSASQGEGDPLHISFAQRYNCNLYLSRLQAHGLTAEEPMVELSPEGLVESAREAVKIGKQIGEKVILMSTSTGGTLSLYLASEDPDIFSLILYSPNIDIADPSSSLLVGPWGLQLARLVMGSNYRTFEGPEGTKQFWTTKYRIEALVALKALVKATMNEETFSKITQPVLTCYYYKNEEEQDDVVSVPRMMEMYDQLSTPEELKQKIALPNVANHGLASKYWSQDIPAVKEATFTFAEEILHLSPVPSP